MTEQAKQRRKFSLWIIILIISHLIILFIGLFLNRFVIDFFIDRYNYKPDKKVSINSSSDSKTVTAYFRKNIQIFKSNPEPIKAEDISIKIQDRQMAKTQKNNKVNFIAITVLWAHYQACQQNMLGENIIPPWQKFNEQKEWKQFLQNIIKDKSWTGWINSSKEVKYRSLKAYEKINNG